MHFASMSLGIFDFLIEWLTQFIMWVVGWVFELINTLLAQLWFKIGTSFATIVDMLQGTFRKLCGMDVYWVGTEKVEGIDPLLQMFTNSNVTQVLLALSLVAVVMVIVGAIIQVVRVEFTTEGSKNSKGTVFGQALKSLMLFFLVPICCIGGVALTNALLKSIDRATNLSSGTSTIGSTIFVSAATNVNRVRAGGNLTAELKKYVGITGDINDTNRESCAQIIDNFFKDDKGASWSTDTGLFESKTAFRPYANWEVAILYYNVYEMNFLLYIGAILIACGIMINATFGMVMRLFKGIILFMVSPPVVALIPLTNSPFNSWRKSFIANTLSAYGTIVGFNLVMLVLPVVNNIKLFKPLTFDGAGAFGGLTAGFDLNGANGLVTIIVTLTGLFMIKDMIKFLSDMINADDANSLGGPMAKKVGKTVGTMAAVAALPVAAAAGPALAAAGSKLVASGKFKGLGKAMSGAGNSLSSMAKSGWKNAKSAAADKASKFIETNTSNIIKPNKDKQDETDEEREKKYKAVYQRNEKGGSTLKDMRIMETEEYKKFVDGVKEANKTASEAKKQTINEADSLLDDTTKHTDSKGIVTRGIEAKQNSVGNRLAEGKGGEALELLNEMLTALKNIDAGQRTDKEKELIVKLEEQKERIQYAGQDTEQLKAIAGSNSFKQTGELTKQVYNEAQERKNVVSNSSFNPEIILNAATAENREAELNKQIEAIVAATGKDKKDVEKILSSELKRIKQELKKIQDSTKED